MTNEKNSLSWQLYQLNQRLKEWWELKTIELGNSLPDDDLFSWLDIDLLETIARFLFWLILFFIVIGFSLKIVDLLTRYFSKYKNQYKSNLIQKSSNNKLILPINKWLKRSHNFAQQGNYRDGIWCLYMAMLQRLNDQGIAPHQLSRTDGEYLKIIQSLPNFNYYQILLINHQKLLFANQEATVKMWEDCEQAFQKINITLNKS